MDNSKPLYRKWLFHQTSIYKWMFGVPRQLCRDFSKPWNQDRSRKKNNQFCAGMFSQRPNYTLDRFLGPQFWQLFKKEGIFWEPFILKREMGSGWSKSPSMDGQNNCQKWVFFFSPIDSIQRTSKAVNQSNGLKGQPKKWVKQKTRQKTYPAKMPSRKYPPKKDLCPLSNVGCFCWLRLLELDHWLCSKLVVFLLRKKKIHPLMVWLQREFFGDSPKK